MSRQLGSYQFARRERHPNVSDEECGRGTKKILRRDADDRTGMTIHTKGFAHDVRVAAHRILPEAVADDHNRLFAELFILLIERATKNGTNSERRKVRGSNQVCPVAFGPATE